MEIISTKLSGLYIIIPDIEIREEGIEIINYNKKEFKETIGNIEFLQDNESCSDYGVVRGLHFQIPPYAQSKLIRCVKGKIMDVAVDIRKNSNTYGMYVSVELSESNHKQVFIPKGFAHGFVSLAPKSIIQYKCDNYYAPGYEGGIFALDPTLSIEWKINQTKAIMSEKDKHYPELNNFKSPF